MSETSPPSPAAIMQALAVPFAAGEVKLKPQTVSGNRALAIPYVDARVVMDRLDDVLGVTGWQDGYKILPDGAVVCRLRIRIGGEWIAKQDVGGQSEQPDEGDRRKAAFSDALKRAAVKFGIGRYLYRQKPQWRDWDPARKQFLSADTSRRQADKETRRQGDKETGSPPAVGGGLLPRLQAVERQLRDKGLCQTYELLEFVKAELGGKLPGKMSDWSEGEYPKVKVVVDAFVAECKAPATDAQRDALGRFRARTNHTHADVNKLIGRDATHRLDHYTQRDYRRAAMYLTASPGPEKGAV